MGLADGRTDNVAGAGVAPGGRRRGHTERRAGRGALAALCLTSGLIAALAPASALAAAHVFAWGQNVAGSLGNGSTTNSDVPVKTTGLAGAKKLAKGKFFSLAVTTTGTVDAWGSNEYGQLGQGPTEPELHESPVPIAIPNLSGVTSVAAGCIDGLALLSNGTVDVWGGGGSGELAQGEKEEAHALAPIPVKGLTEVKAIAAGCESFLALRKNGTVMGWGDNEAGELGNGTKASFAKEPTLVSGLKGVSAIAEGHDFGMALVKGAVKAWGGNGAGELGNGETTEHDTPVSVIGLTGVKAISAGGYHALALMSDGTVKAWGLNNEGQVGDGTQINREVPVAVSGLSEVKAIATGDAHSYALLLNKTVKAWGDDEFGELGNGEFTLNVLTPVAVSGLTGVTVLGVGGGSESFFSLAAP